MSDTQYAIGTPGQAWAEQEKQQWLALQQVKRSYQTDVVEPLQALPRFFQLEQYGELDYQAQGFARYPLYVVKSQAWQEDKPTVLITGGVHGYETSGVHGALRFALQQASDFAADFNFIIAPCISPWAYETINRWNPFTVDPNRAFADNSQSAEASLLRGYLQQLGVVPLAHIDLHETTDSDNSEFRPAKAAREGTVNTNWNIPDGFYLVADAQAEQVAFQQAILAEVAKVTQIAPADEQGKLIGEPVIVPGLISYPKQALGLCGRVTAAPYVSTTEVYPDSPVATPEQCIQAQVAAIRGALTFLSKEAIN